MATQAEKAKAEADAKAIADAATQAEKAKAEAAPTHKRAKIQWKNVHGGDGLVYRKGMILDMPIELFNEFDKLTKTIGEYDVDAVKATDVGATHEVVIIADIQSIVEIADA